MVALAGAVTTIVLSLCILTDIPNAIASRIRYGKQERPERQPTTR